MKPIPYSGTPEEARERLLEVLRGYPRTRIVVQEPGYLKVECRSRIFRFVDDVELVFDDEARLIRFRSASRLGRGDFAVNRKRMKEMLAELDVPQGMGVILRTAGLERSKSEIRRDYDYLMRLWDSIRELTFESKAPALIYEEGDIIKRSLMGELRVHF